MRQPTQCLIAILGVSFSSVTAEGDELRTYQFIVDGSLPYFVSCGECGPSLLGARADIAGTFTVALNQDAGTGTLLDLNDHLVNVLTLSSSPGGPVWQPADPAEWNFGIIPPWTPEYTPPLEGSLSVDGETIYLISDGLQTSPDGMSVRIVPSFTIAMRGDQATFDMVVPIDDWFITVTQAKAELMPGDHNGDGTVDAADYVVWRDAVGTTTASPNDWRANFGRTTAAGAGSVLLGASVPEPAALVMLLAGLLATLFRRSALAL